MLSADNSFFSSAESISSKGVLLSKFSLCILLMWQHIKLTSETVSLLKLVPLGIILRINLWLFST